MVRFLTPVVQKRLLSRLEEGKVLEANKPVRVQC